MYLHEVAEEEASFTKDDMSKARFTVLIFDPGPSAPDRPPGQVFGFEKVSGKTMKSKNIRNMKNH